MASSVEDRGYAPAFPAVYQQQQKLKRRLRHGFEDANELILWQHDVDVYSLGFATETWHSGILTDRYQIRVLTSDDRDESDQTVSEILQEVVTPAFRSAQGFLRQAAMDFQEKVDVDKRYPAMRPRVGQLASAQRSALESVLDLQPGQYEDTKKDITTREDLNDWVDKVVYATAGGVDDAFLQQVVSPASEWWRAIFGPNQAYLHILLAEEVLPQMNDAIRNAAYNSDEQPGAKDIEITGSSGSIT